MYCALYVARTCAIAFVVASSVAFAQYSGSAPVSAPFKKGFDSITQEDCKKWLEVLAGEECAGRGTGQPGYQKAADYMAARFKEFGLKPVGDNGTYFQQVPFEQRRMNPEQSTISIGSKAIKASAGFKLDRLHGSAEARGPIVFFRANGNGVSLPHADEIAGKIIIAAIGSDATGIRRGLTRSAAAAVLFVTKEAIDNEWTFGRQSSGQGNQRSLQGRVSQKCANDLAKAAGINTEFVDLESLAGETIELSGTSQEAKLVAKLEEVPVGVPNVVGLLEGSDPVLKSEIVGIGSHLDHLGKQDGVIYYGADDDGSGSTALLAVAKAFSKSPKKPKRSILFMAFCGEEMGLIGSGHYSDHPIFPNDKMICELQMDMVGRNEQKDVEKPEDNVDTIHLVGSKKLSTELHDLVLEANKHVNFKFEWDEEDVYTRSDHYMFAKVGIPIAFVFSGFHPDYHQPSDTIEKINFEKIANTAKLYYLVADMAANREQRFKIDGKG
ncbi:MAG: M28 family metallopeptidase [Fimbriimonadales bacterium]